MVRFDNMSLDSKMSSDSLQGTTRMKIKLRQWLLASLNFLYISFSLYLLYFT